MQLLSEVWSVFTLQFWLDRWYQWHTTQNCAVAQCIESLSEYLYLLIGIVHLNSSVGLIKQLITNLCLELPFHIRSISQATW